MRERKPLYLVIFALAVVTVSFVLISVWGYHFYFAQLKVHPVVPTSPKEQSSAPKKSINDSTQAILNNAIEDLNVADDSVYDTSEDKTLALKLIEFNRLKNEIAEIVKKKLSSKEISAANDKILQLQQSVAELKNENNDIRAENDRLKKLVKEQPGKANDVAQNTPVAPNPNQPVAKSPSALPVLLTHLRFAGSSVADNKKVETNETAKTANISGSFQINVKPFNQTPEIYVIVIQPDGKTLYNSANESGMFATKNGRKIYSAVLHFNNKETGTRLSFSINVPHFQKGKYIMQVYHQGVMIGRVSKSFF
ncbi:MAG: hypothetical protein ABI267_05065 [Ginsengibacter sp.]